MGAFRDILCFCGIFIGLAICAAGRMLLKYVLFGVVVAGVITACNFCVFEMTRSLDHGDGVFWVTFFVAAVVGLLVAWLSTMYRRVGAFIVAAWTGFEIGATISNIMYDWVPNLAFFWLIIVTSALSLALVAIVNPNKHMIWVTAIFGAYIFCFTMAYFFARWPIDLDLPYLYKEGAVDGSMLPSYFLALGVWLSISIIGAVFQFYVLWYYKKTGKEIHPRLSEAV